MTTSRIDIIGQNGNDGEHYAELVEWVDTPANPSPTSPEHDEAIRMAREAGFLVPSYGDMRCTVEMVATLIRLARAAAAPVDMAWPKPDARNPTWTICPEYLERIQKSSDSEYMPGLEEIEAVLLALKPSAPVVPEGFRRITLDVSNDNEITSEPWWLIIDPRQMMSPDVHTVASMITGPFFSREEANTNLNARRYAFSDKARVYCHSGCWSSKYKQAMLAAAPTPGATK